MTFGLFLFYALHVCSALTMLGITLGKYDYDYKDTERWNIWHRAIIGVLFLQVGAVPILGPLIAIYHWKHYGRLVDFTLV